VLTIRGKIYVCGSCEFGELGMVPKQELHTFKKLSFLNQVNVKKIFAGPWNSWAVIDNPNPDYM